MHSALENATAGFYLEILFWGGNMVAKDSKGHNTLLCTVGAFATKPASAFNTHTWSVIKHRAIPVELVIYYYFAIYFGGEHTLVSPPPPPPPDKTLCNST